MAKVRVMTTLSADLRTIAKKKGIPLSYALSCGLRNILKQKTEHGTFDREQSVKLERTARLLDKSYQEQWRLRERMELLEEELKKWKTKI